jgi:hypothetical protein
MVNNHHNKRRTKKKSKKSNNNKDKESQYKNKESFKMNGGKVKKCMCIDFEKKGSAYINYEHGKKCLSDVVSGTDFCSKHQDCMNFGKNFLNKYELPYNPDLWNKKPDIKNSHNCYTYFLDNQINPVIEKCKKLTKDSKSDKCGDLKPQPGDFYMLVNNGTLDGKNRNYSCKDMNAKILNDNPSIQKTNFNKKCPIGSYKGAMVVDPGNTYHFYRQNADGTWSHKPGVLSVTDLDASGNRIYFPHIANRNYREGKSSGINYTDFCTYFCIPRKGRVNIYAI